MNTSLLEPKRLSANQRLLRANEDPSRREAMRVLLDVCKSLSRRLLLRKIGKPVPEQNVQRYAHESAARIALAVALVEDETAGDVLFRRAGEVFETVYGSPHATSQTRLTSGHERPRTDRATGRDKADGHGDRCVAPSCARRYLA